MLLRTAVLELESLDDKQVVKVAGVMRRMKNWVKSLVDPEYASAVDRLHEESSELKGTLHDLNQNIEHLLKSIKDGDVQAYDEYLSVIRTLSKELVSDLGKVNRDAEASKNEMYTSEDWKNPEYRKHLLNKIRNEKIKDIPIAEDVKNKNYQFYDEKFKNHLYEKELVISPASEKLLFEKLDQFILDENISENISIEKFRPVFIQRLTHAIRNGKIVKYEPEAASDSTKRFVGDMILIVKTAPIQLPEINMYVEMVVLLHDITHRSGESSLLFGSMQSIRGASSIMPAILPSTAHVRLKVLRKLAGVDKSAVKSLPDSFWVKFVEMSNRLGAKPEDLAKVINSESGFDPKATNIQGGRVIAKGLNQLILSTAKVLGMTENDWNNLENLPAEQQLDWVEKYFRSVGKDQKWSNATQLYVANFAPKYIRQSSNPNAVLYQGGTKEYSQNKGLDRDGKGFITAGDLGRSVQGNLPNYIIASIEKAKSGTSETVSVADTSLKSDPSNDSDSDELLQVLYANQDGFVEKIVKSAILSSLLPTTQILITLSTLSDSYQNRMKFAESISFVLKDIIDAETEIRSDGNKIEIQCSVIGSTYNTCNAVQALCECTLKASKLYKSANSIIPSNIKYLVYPASISKFAKVG